MPAGNVDDTEAAHAKTEIRIGENSGTLNLAIPSINIKMIGQKFDQQWSLRKAASSVEEQARMLRLVRKSSLKVETVLKGPRMLVEDLLGLEEGDVVMFDYAVERPLTSVVNGVPKFTGRIISNGNRKAFRIEDHYKA
jgi:flagellar motor switch protein FliM